MSVSDPAILAAATYRMDGAGDKETRIKAAQDYIDEQGNEEGWEIDPKYSNRDILVFTTDDKIHISHKGTSPLRKKDLIADLGIAIGREQRNKTFTKRKTQTINALKAYPDKEASASAHSLGGSTLYNATASNKYIGERLKKIDTYNQGISPFSGRISKAKERDLKDKVTIHRTTGDPVSASAIANKPIGKVVTYKPSVKSSVPTKLLASLVGMGFTLDSYNAHSIRNFID